MNSKASKKNEFSGAISNIQNFSLNDGRGIRTVVFFKGCMLRCPWCSNPETQNKNSEIMYTPQHCLGCLQCMDVCPLKCITVDENHKKISIDKNICLGCGTCYERCVTGALSLIGDEMTVNDVFQQILKDKPFYTHSNGGVTLSGGEVFMQPKFAFQLLKKCKNEYINTAIETCGFGEWEEIKNLIKVTDAFLYDLKIIDEKKHLHVTGVSNKSILSNLSNLAKTNAEIIIRFPLIPNYTTDKNNVKDICNIMRNHNLKRIDLLPYHNYGESKYKKLNKEYALHGVKKMEDKDVKHIKKTFDDMGFTTRVDG